MPYDTSEEARLAALERYGILDTPAEPNFDRTVQIAAHEFHQPIAVLAFADRSRHWLKARVGINPREIPRGVTFFEHAILSDDILIVPDAAQDVRFRDDEPLGTLLPAIRFFAGAPLITPDGYHIGSLCILSPEPMHGFDSINDALLADLAGSIMTRLELRRSLQLQTKVSADLHFWNKLSTTIATARDFDSAIEHTLTACLERTGAKLCALVEVFPSSGEARYLKCQATGERLRPAVGLDAWAIAHPVVRLSFGPALLEKRSADTGPLNRAADWAGYPILEKLIEYGVRRQVSYPFDLANRQFGLILSFEESKVPPTLSTVVDEFLTRLVPLLLGRLEQDALKHANRALQTIHACNEAFERAQDELTIFQAACDIAVQIGGYSACWIGLAEQDAEKSVRPIAAAGPDTDMVRQLRLSWADVPRGQGPTGTALRENRIVVARDIPHDPRFAPWRNIIPSASIRSGIALPLVIDDKPPFAALGLYSSKVTSFAGEELNLLQQLIANLTKAIGTVRARFERDAAHQAHTSTAQRLARLLTTGKVVLYALKFRNEQLVPTEVSDNITQLMGYSLDEALADGWWEEHVHPEDRPAARTAIHHVMNSGSYVHRYRFQHRSGEYRWIRDEMTFRKNAAGIPAEVTGSWIDITEQQIAEEQIHRLAHIDPLTDLPNRRQLNLRLEQVLKATRGTDAVGALLLIDLDQFKVINDLVGHSVGNEVLCEVARRLQFVVRKNDTVARIGDDQFVVLLPDLATSRDQVAIHAGKIARKLVNTIASAPVSVNGSNYHIGASIGFTLFSKDSEEIETLIREADTAMYQAKAGGTDIILFQPTMQLELLARHAIEDELRNALKTDRFEVWLQDQVDTGGARIGAEALIRLRTPDGTIMMPDNFIGIAEATGLILPIGRWILQESCKISHEIHKTDPAFCVSVNVSPRQFHDTNFVADVLAVLDLTGFAPDKLILEITESLLIEDIAATERIMRKLTDRGIRFSVDDFGTGYSSLQYLHRLPINEIKIDRSFISRIPTNASAVAITEAILSIGRSLDLEIVAEGVENLGQAEFLLTKGSVKMQGYLFGRPLPSREWTARFTDDCARSGRPMQHRLVAR